MYFEGDEHPGTLRARIEAMLSKEPDDPESDHGERDELLVAALRTVVESPDDPEARAIASLAVDMLAHTSDWTRWYA